MRPDLRAIVVIGLAVILMAMMAVGAAQATVRKVSLTTPVQAGSDASLTVNVSPRARCTVEVIYNTVVSKAKGLGPKTGSRITWRWKVGTSTHPGRWPVIVRCGKSGTLNHPASGGAVNSQTILLVDRMLAVLREDVLPLTREGVREGNKTFGAAVLRKESLDLVAAGTNEEARNPLLHGEISCLNRYWSLPRERRPPPAECLFLSSHEPCPMCLSAIAWSGFDNFYYLFSYEDTRDGFEIPHDLAILAEVFRCPDGAYADENAYWTSYHLLDLVEQGPQDERARWREQVADLRSAYGVLSDDYQARKRESDIPLA